MGDRQLRRTIWEDRRAIFEHLTPQTIDKHDNAAGKWLITQPKIKPNYVPWITYSNTDILQAPGSIVLCCPADLLSFSATACYVIRENGQENIFHLRPSVGTAMRLTALPLPLELSNLSPWYLDILDILDQLTYTPESPITALVALSMIHDWSCIHMGDRPLRRTIWEDRRAIFEHLTPQPIDKHDNAAGKWLITQPKIKPNYVPWITYSNTDILQAPRTVVLCCPADLLSFSATACYVIRENGQENIFHPRPSVGTAMCLTALPLPLELSNLSPWYQSLQQTSTPTRMPHSPLT